MTTVAEQGIVAPEGRMVPSKLKALVVKVQKELEVSRYEASALVMYYDMWLRLHCSPSFVGMCFEAGPRTQRIHQLHRNDCPDAYNSYCRALFPVKKQWRLDCPSKINLTHSQRFFEAEYGMPMP